jgi:hypothetical protein
LTGLPNIQFGVIVRETAPGGGWLASMTALDLRETLAAALGGIIASGVRRREI